MNAAALCDGVAAERNDSAVAGAPTSNGVTSDQNRRVNFDPST
jgi:hypothetical protein